MPLQDPGTLASQSSPHLSPLSAKPEATVDVQAAAGRALRTRSLAARFSPANIGKKTSGDWLQPSLDT